MDADDWIDCEKDKFDQKQIFRQVDQALDRLEADPETQRDKIMLFSRMTGMTVREV